MRASSTSTRTFCAILAALLVFAAKAAAPSEGPAAETRPDWRLGYRTALELMRGRKYAEAMGKLKECVERREVPAYHAAHILVSVGQCQLHLRDYVGAEATFRRTAASNPGGCRPHYWLGKTRLLQDDTEGALEHFGEALRLDGSAQDVYWERAQIAADTGDPAAELADLESFLRCCSRGAGGRAAWAKTRLFCEDVRQLREAIPRAGKVARPVRRVLITGFGPFASFAVNPSWEGVRALDGSTIAGAEVHAVLLPVNFLGATAAMREAIERVKPDLVLAFGLGGRSHFGIETIARRPTKREKPDSAGSPEEALAIDDPALPATHLTRLPVLHMIERLSQEGVPVSARDNAGRYVCNHIFYTVAHLLRETDLLYGFVHVPCYATDDRLLGGIEVSRHKMAMRLIVETAIDGANAGYTDDPLTPVLVDVLSLAPDRYNRSYQRSALLRALGAGQR